MNSKSASLEEINPLNIIGKTIAGIVCHKYYVLNEILIVEDVNKQSKAILYSSLPANVKLHTIEQQEVVQVQVARDGAKFLFHTKTKAFLINEQNQIIEDSDQWDDFYFDELSSSFYRKDRQSHWYDIEGFRMQEQVFLKEDILISLETKTSKQSLSFKGSEIFISAHKQLIQVGKLVLDLHLNVVKYYGEKITGLGRANIEFAKEDALQEVKLGLVEVAFINEYSHEPFMFGDSNVIKHEETYQYGQQRVVVLRTDKNSFGLLSGSNEFLSYEGKPLQIENPKHLRFNEAELIKVSDGKKSFYFDLNENKAFSIPSLGEKYIKDFELEHIRIGNDRMFNVASPVEKFVINERNSEIFKLDEGSIQPSRIEDAGQLKKYYGFAIIDGHRKMFSKKEAKVLKFGKDALEVSEIIYHAQDKFINAIDTNGNKLVLDLRHGFDDISLAESNGDKVLEFYGVTMAIGNMILLNVYLETLGGNIRRVLNVNDESLACFTLPDDLKQIGDQDIPSVFAGNFISEIHFFEEIIIERKIFISADLEAFTGKEYPIILYKETGDPLHLQGNGHRNELASTWIKYSLENRFYLGENRMVGVQTISEDQKENNLLFSVQQLTSWLPFFDNYLPIFKQIIEVPNELSDTWDYNLFELREVSKEKEYLAVEKKPPFRILAEKKNGEFRPKIVKSKKKSITSPEELNTLQRFFFAGSNTLVEVE